MESLADTNKENNSSMLIISDKYYLNKSFNKYLPEKPEENRNQRVKIDNKNQNSTKDTRNNDNGNSNINSTFQKTFSLFNESNYDSNSQTDRSSKNLKEIKVNISSKKRKNNPTNNQNQNLSYNENNINDFQPSIIAYLSENKLSKILFIQKCWKKYYKIIIIQKYFKGFLVRKNMAKIIYFIKSTFKIIFKLIIDNIKNNIQIQDKNNIISNIYNTELKKNYNNKSKKIGSNNKLSKKMKLNYHPSFNTSNKICLNRKLKELKKVGNKKIKKDNFIKMGNNNPINVNFANNQNILINTSNKYLKNKFFKTNNKNGKEKVINKISHKDRLIANNIFNIYNNVKKYYENENNNNSNHNNNCLDSNYLTDNNFFTKNKKNSFLTKNNKSKNKNLKKMITRGSMKNINEKIIINKNNNINVNININNNPKTDRINREKDSNPKKNEIDSILYLLKLKKTFLLWSSFIIKKKILQKLKIIKSINTPSNTKKTLPIFTIKDKEKEKTKSIKTKKINISNSLISIKLDKITPQKLKMKSNNKTKNKVINNNFTNKINRHSISVENNNSMINLNPQKSLLNSSFNNGKNNNMKGNNHNQCSNNIFNNSVIVVSQYDRNNEIKNKYEKNNKNNSINNKKKLFYFYAIINLIDKHNKRKIIKKYFYLWKSMKFSHKFINSSGIEEKIISFKNIKSPLKYNSLFPNNSSGNFNCQTEEGREPRFGHCKLNTNINHQELLTPNPLEKANHSNLFKSNIKSSQIVYQKKLLVQKKMRNQSIHPININEVEEDRNMTLVNNNHDMNIYNQTIGNNFYNLNTFMNNSNDFHNSQFFVRRNNFEKNNGKVQEGRIKGINGIEETEIFFNINQTNTIQNRFIVGLKNSKEEIGLNSNKINVNVVENYRKIDLKKNEKNSIRYSNNNDKNGITTKQIVLGDKNKRFKNYSHSQEFRNNNQSF